MTVKLIPLECDNCETSLGLFCDTFITEISERNAIFIYRKVRNTDLLNGHLCHNFENFGQVLPVMRHTFKSLDIAKNVLQRMSYGVVRVYA